MEHLCNQCGAIVEDGTPFCRQCRAPQIRIAVAEPPQPPRASYDLEAQGFSSVTPLSSPAEFNRIQRARTFRATTAAGLIGAVLMLTPIGAFGLGMLIAGFLAIALYRRNNLAPEPAAGMGARLGLITGAIGFVFFAILLAGEIAVLHKGGELRTALIHAVEQAAARSSDPQAQAVAAWLKSPDGLVLMIALSLFFTFIVFLIFASLGGALGTVILRKKHKPY